MPSTKGSTAIVPVQKDPEAGHCPICRDEIDFYSYGACDHPTCSRCAVKIRRFGNTDEPDFSKCATCRAPLNRVILMTSFKPFSQVDLTSLIHEVELDFLFENEVVEACYKKLITCKCLVCNFVAKTMSALNRHTTTEHNLSYCDLCLRNARLLPSEFIPMEPQALAAHRKWDKERKRGHPKCEFCDNTFYEFEDLVKHIREAHFLCDFCHANGAFEVFRRQHELLQHYKDAHFVCSECDAKGRIVCYATFDQLGLHRLHEHPQETANDPRRWDPVQIRYPTQGLYGQHGRVDMRASGQRPHHGPPEPEADSGASPERPAPPEAWTGADFPSLDRPNIPPSARQEPPPGAVPTTTAQQTSSSGPSRSLASIVGRGRVNMMSAEDFPSLPSAPGADATPASSTQVAATWTRSAATAAAPRSVAEVAATSATSAARRAPAQSEFPALEGSAAEAVAPVTNWGRQSGSVNKKETPTTTAAAMVARHHKQPVPKKSDFPSLNGAAAAMGSESSPLPPPLIPPVSVASRRQQQQQQKKMKKAAAAGPPGPTAVVPKAPQQPTTARLTKGKWWNYAGDIDSEPVRDEAAELAARNHIQLIPANTVESAPAPRQAPNFSTDDFPTLSAKDSAVLAHPVTKPPQQQGGESKKNKQQKKQNTPVVANGNAKQVPQSTENTVLNDLEDTELVIFDKVTYVPPLEAAVKNQELIRVAESCLTGSASATKNSFSRFADLSRRYRYGQLSASAYLQGLDGLLSRLQSNGSDSGQLDWLASMISLLPDVGRQRALLRALKGEAAPRVPHAATPQRALATTPPAWCKPVCNKLSICTSCGQVCLRSELKIHTGAAHP